MPTVTLGEIADLVEGDFQGDRDRRVTGARSLGEAGPEDLSFLANAKYQKFLATTRAGAILVERGMSGESSRWIRVRDPYLALAMVLQKFFAGFPLPEGISPDARIASSASLGEGVRIGAFATVGEEAKIGNRVVLFEGVHVGAGAEIADDTILHPGVTVYYGCKIGRRCIVHSGVVIGADGYGFASSGGIHHKIPQIGIVRIEDDVEIGANTTIDRAALGETVVGAGTKIDNLVQVAHNARIGKGCLIVAQTALAGSCEVGDYSVLAGQSGVSGHVRIGAKVMVAAQSAVMKDFEGPITLAGSPARPLREHLKGEALTRRLPDILARLEALERKGGSE